MSSYLNPNIAQHFFLNKEIKNREFQFILHLGLNYWHSIAMSKLAHCNNYISKDRNAFSKFKLLCYFDATFNYFISLSAFSENDALGKKQSLQELDSRSG